MTVIQCPEERAGWGRGLGALGLAGPGGAEGVAAERELESLGLKGSIGDRSNHSNFEPSEFGQNSVRILGNSSTIFRKFLKFEKFSTFSKVFSEIPRNFR